MFFIESYSRMGNLILKNSNIGLNATKMLHDLLIQNIYIKQLDLSNNNLGFSGVEILASALQDNKTIIELNLS